MDIPLRNDARTIGRNLMLVTGGQVALLALWFGATTLLARKLGPEALGLYALSVKVVKVLTTCLGDPLDLAVMRQAPVLLRSNRPAALTLVRSAFIVRVGLGLAIILLTAAFPAFFALLMFRDSSLVNLVLLTSLGILTDLLLRSVAGFLQASEDFGRFMVVNATWQTLRAGAIIAVVLLGAATAFSALAIYASAPLVACMVGVALLPRDLLQWTRPDLRQISAVLHYGKWLAMAMALAAIYEGLDLFMLAWLRDQRQVGIYAGAMTLAIIPDFLNGAVQTVLAPKVAPAYAAGEFPRLLWKYLRFALPVGALALAGALLLGSPIIRVFLSNRFAESSGVFKILIVATILDVVFTPLPNALVVFVRPRVVPLINLIALIWVITGGLVLIRGHGATGAAIAVLVARMLVGVLTIGYAAGVLRNRDRHHLA
jgi:O-antigen/teichoic acid export membrane protein